MPGLTNSATKKTAHTVRQVARAPRNLVPQRRQTYPTGGGKACSPKLAILVMGQPNGGTITIPMTVNGVEEDVEIEIPASITDLQEAFESHSEVEEGQMPFTSASGGTAGLPTYEVYCSPAEGLSLKDVELGTPDLTELTGGNFVPTINLRKCCVG